VTVINCSDYDNNNGYNDVMDDFNELGKSDDNAGKNFSIIFFLFISTQAHRVYF
jgi:hypothetical protein